MEKDIQLYSHNEKAYQALLSSLEEYPLAFIEHATGTGKSFILLKYLYKKMRDKRILFVSMHDEMFEQLFNEQMNTLGISKNDFNKFDTLIYHNLPKQNAKELIDKYDCIIFDEAHHCGAKIWGETVSELKELVLQTPNKQMIGTTATSVRYLDKYMDVSEIFFDGKVVSKLPISTSMLENILPAPFYINSALPLKENLARIKTKLKNIPINKEIETIKEQVKTIEKEIKTENDVASMLKAFDVKLGEKYIVFCTDLSDLEKKKKSAHKWFKNIGEIKIFEAHSKQKKEDNKKQINEFSKDRNEISLMFAVDIFNEGFHIKNLDGILMFRRTKSPIIYFQQLGRALSFSVRKKQIKIFDFVNNLSSSDIVYELYKEILEEIKLRISKEPEKKELYETILSRFQIVDYTTNILDELNNIEQIIDEKYLMRSIIENAILKLEQYRYFYPKNNFNKDYLMNRLSLEYIRAFEYLRKNNDNIDLNGIRRLQNLNINFGLEINMPIEKRILILDGYNTFSELKQEHLKLFEKEFIEFCVNNNRRPTDKGTVEEKELYKQYRYYLEKLTKTKLSKILYRLPLELTVEEEILLDNRPTKENIIKYINFITNKLNNLGILDSVEIITLKKLENIFSLDPIILTHISDNSSINYKIECAIENLQNFENNILLYTDSIIESYEIINKYATRITTPQFEKLIALNIKLPDVINMTLETRKKILGRFNSFYEKKQYEKKTQLERYIDFIKINGRRPLLQTEFEKELSDAYDEFIVNIRIDNAKKLCEVLMLYDIPLYFTEKILLKKDVEHTEIKNYLKNIEQKIIDGEELSSLDIKLLENLSKYNYVEEKEDFKILFEIISRYKLIFNYIKKYKLKIISISEFNKNINNNSNFITKGLLEKLINMGADIPNNIKDKITSLNIYKCIYEKELKSEYDKLNEIKEYITINKKLPDNELYIEYRNILSGLNEKEAIDFLNFVVSNNIDLNIEERILYGIIDYNEINSYMLTLEDKFKEKKLDLLEKRTIKELKKKKIINAVANYMFNPYGNQEELYKNIKKLIEKDPRIIINYKNDYPSLSIKNQNKLETYRINLIAEQILKRLILLMKKEKKSLKSLSNLAIVKEFDNLNKYRLNESNSKLFSEIKLLDKELRLIEKNILKENVIENFINYIANNNVVPSKHSENEEERKIALDLESVKNNLVEDEIKRINKIISDNQKMDINTFYDQYIDFIKSNHRFPSANSDNEEEVFLNRYYISIKDELSLSQKNIIKNLKKLYEIATLKADINFKKLKKL